jgi:rod shape-determining protein MreC
MALDQRFSLVIQLRSALVYVTSPFQYMVNWPIKTYQNVTQSVLSQKALVNENMELRYKQVVLKGRLQRLLSLQKENKQLRKLLDYKGPGSGDKFLLAELLSIKTNTYRQMLVLDRGGKDNIFIGQAVFDSLGVMGQIVEVGPYTSTVMLITDPESAVPVKNARTGERAILIGTNHSDELSLINLASTSSVKVGDELLTSGLGKRFPEGYPIGMIRKVIASNNEAFMQVLAKPKAQLGKSRLMLLSWHNDFDKRLLHALSSVKHKTNNEKKG